MFRSLLASSTCASKYFGLLGKPGFQGSHNGATAPEGSSHNGPAKLRDPCLERTVLGKHKIRRHSRPLQYTDMKARAPRQETSALSHLATGSTCLSVRVEETSESSHAHMNPNMASLRSPTKSYMEVPLNWRPQNTSHPILETPTKSVSVPLSGKRWPWRRHILELPLCSKPESRTHLPASILFNSN